MSWWRFQLYLKEWWVMLRPAKGEPLPSARAIRWLWKSQFGHVREQFYMWIVWHILPKKLVMWAAIRVMAHASQGQWGNEHPGSISMMTMLQRWDIQHVDTGGNNGEGVIGDLADDSPSVDNISGPPFIPYLMRWTA